MKSRRSKATDIPKAVKQAVWERDGGTCVFCGMTRNADPNAHFIPRSAGGLGIEENILTACNRFSPNDCHYRFDNGSKEERAAMREQAREYLKSKHPGWNETDLYYRKETR